MNERVAFSAPRTCGDDPVEQDAVARLADRDLEPDRHADVDAVVVQEILEREGAVGELRDLGAGHPLGMVEHGVGQLPDLGDAVAAAQIGERNLGDVAGRELRPDVAGHHLRHPDVQLEELEEGLVAPARLVDPHRRDPHALLVDLDRIGRVRARDATADIGVVGDRAREGDELALDEDRLEDEDVGQVHAAVEGIVQRVDVARPDRVAETGQHRRERGRHGAEMGGKREALGDHPTPLVEEAGRVVEVVAQHGGVGRAVDRERHLVGHGHERVSEQLELERVDGGGHRELVSSRRTSGGAISMPTARRAIGARGP